MLTPSPRRLPHLSEIRDVFRLGPCVEPLDRPGVPDFFDHASGRFAYRFFRDCEVAPFFRTTDRFDPSDAWVLSDAAWLAYADARMEPETEAASEHAADPRRERFPSPGLGMRIPALPRAIMMVDHSAGVWVLLAGRLRRPDVGGAGTRLRSHS